MDATDNELGEAQYYECCVVELYNSHRAHAALDGSPLESIPDRGGARASLLAHRWQVHCRGLYQTPMAA
jgi:hypothetical protein